jgi:hypothetical protein
MHRRFPTLFLAAAILASGCQPKVDNKDAIRDGVVKHLSGMNGLNVNNMTVVVTKATVNGDKAQADVEIRAKNAEAGAPAMELSYDLQKQGGEWVVLKGQPTGGMQHPAAGEAPPPGAMPAGHPPVDGNGKAPANHPDFNSILNSTQPPPQQTQPQATNPSSNGAAKP